MYVMWFLLYLELCYPYMVVIGNRIQTWTDSDPRLAVEKRHEAHVSRGREDRGRQA